MRSTLLKPRYQDPWWPLKAFVHVSADHPQDHVAGKIHEVCNGRLIRCPFTACLDGTSCNGLAVSLRVFDPKVSVHLGIYYKDGKSYWSVSSEERSKRIRSGDPGVGRYSDGWITPKAICLSYVTRGRRRGYRWCGHKSSDKRCRCRHGFMHLKDGGW